MRKTKLYQAPKTETQEKLQKEALRNLRDYCYRSGMHASSRQLKNKIRALRRVLRALSDEPGVSGVFWEERVAMHEGYLDAAIARGLAGEDGALSK